MTKIYPSRFSVLLVIAFALLAPASVQAQVPEPLPVTNRWALDYKPGPLRLTSIEVDGKPQLFLYHTYEVRNFDKTELRLVPSLTLMSDQGFVQTSGQGVPAVVVRTLLDRLKDPLLHDQISVIGPIKRGEEHARRGLAIWPVLDSDPDELRIFAAGFSGESETVTMTDPRTGAEKELVFRKTRQLRFLVPGELRADSYGDRPLTQLGARWIMR